MRRRCSGQRILRTPDLLQRRLPAALQLGGNEAVVGIDAVELSLCKRRLVATAFELLLRTLSHCLVCLALSAACPGQCVDLGWGQCAGAWA